MLKRLKSYWILIIPLVIFSGYWLTRPFQQSIGEGHSDISRLRTQSKANIGLACRKLDGYIIKPGETFSFNKVIGPRTQSRGFRPAPTYMGKSTSATDGGGICLVSSLLYKAALESGLKILERTPHSRTISTVPPGLDATVWYGRYDLRFQNNTNEPIMLQTKFDGNLVSIIVRGPAKIETCKIMRREQDSSGSQVAVTVLLRRGDQWQTVSKDLYDRSKL